MSGFPALLDASKGQLLVVWDALQAALAVAVAAARDAPLPPYNWADEDAAVTRAVPLAEREVGKTKVDPELRARANAAVEAALATGRTRSRRGPWSGQRRPLPAPCAMRSRNSAS